MPADGQQALVRAPIQSGGSVAAIIPQTFDDAWRIAGALATSGLTSFKRHEEALAAIMAGAEVGLPPFASLQSFMYVNGRLSMWGDAMLALVQSRGHKVEEWHEGSLEAGDFTAWCKVTRSDTGVIYLESFSIEDAKRAGLWQTQETVRRKSKDGGWYEAKNDAPWFRYPKRMMKYRARGFGLRDGASDVLRGIKMVEEVQDYPQLEDAALNARVIDASGDADQRPDEERDPRIGKYGVIGGQPARDICDELCEAMSACEDLETLEAIEPQIDGAKVSANRTFSLNEHFERCRHALENGEPCPPAPTFAKEEAPSPFAALKTEGEAVQTLEAFNTWNAKMKTALGACTPDERELLKPIHAAAKERAGKPNPERGAPGRSEDAGKVSNDGAAPGGSESPASSSPLFEALKDECLAILKVNGPKRQRAKWTEFTAKLLDAKTVAALSDAERAELATINDNVGKEIDA